ncbi:MAG TPA: YceI family protein [Solirubrobacteraceae bacterium]|nr:YceI family protein [Solirubrobacteraceae bacterium]
MPNSTEQSPPAVLLPVGIWRIDPAHSTVGFVVREMTHLIVSVHGRFTDFDGTIEVTSTGAQARGAVRVASITTDHRQRDQDLRSPQFLDAAGSPLIRFESDAVELIGDHALRIAGRLTFKGTQSDIELDGEILGTGTDHSNNERLAIAAEGDLPFGPMQVKLVLDVSAIKTS